MLPVYCGVKHQYGYGLGSIFKTALFRAKHRQNTEKKKCWDLDLLFH